MNMIAWGIFYIIATFILGYFFVKEKKVIEITKDIEDRILQKITLKSSRNDKITANVLSLVILIINGIFFFLVDKTPDRYIQMKLIGVYGVFIINIIIYVLRRDYEYAFLTNLIMLFLGRLMFNILDTTFYVYLLINMLFSFALIYFGRKVGKQILSVNILKQEARENKNKLNPNRITEETVEIEKRKRSTIGVALGRIVTTIFAIVIVGIIQNFYIGNYVIPSGSMEPIIMVKDRVFANMAKYKFMEPKVGEIIAFKEPINNQVMYTKRITGAPGSTLQIVDGKIYENDKEQTKLNRSYATEGIFYNKKIYIPKKGDKISLDSIVMIEKISGTTTDGRVVSGADYEGYYNGEFTEELTPAEFLSKINKKDNFKDIIGIEDGYVKGDPTKEFYYTFKLKVEGRDELVLPIFDFKYDDELFMKLLNGEIITLKDDYYMAMGDNTENSYDSRYFGYVAKNRIKGQLLLRWWPLNRIGIL